MNNYELTVILRISESLEALKNKVSEILQRYGVAVQSQDDWGEKKLAYEIDGEKDGHYLLLNIEATPDSIQKIISDFRLISDILRYLFVKIKKKKSA